MHTAHAHAANANGPVGKHAEKSVNSWCKMYVYRWRFKMRGEKKFKIFQLFICGFVIKKIFIFSYKLF